MADVAGQVVAGLDQAAGTLAGVGAQIVDGLDQAGGQLPGLPGHGIDFPVDPEYVPPIPPVVDDITISSVELLSSGTLLLTFSSTMKNNSGLSATTSYTITADGAGKVVTVLDVLVGEDDSVDEVVLIFSEPSIGEQYTVAVATTLTGVDEHTIDPDNNSKSFETRETKMNGFLNHLPLMFSRDLRTSVGVLLQALAREDDKIGGSRDDYLD